MTNHSIHRSTISRRNLIKAGAISGATLFTGHHQWHQVAAQDMVSAAPAELLEMIQQTADPELGIDALTEVFARSGIAVFDEQGVTQINSPVAPVSALAFMRWQLAPMVTELSTGVSRPASEYDAMFPAETEEGDAVPTVGELLAGYYDGVGTAGSEFTRAFLDQFVTDDFLIEAGDLPAPTAIIALLGGEIMAQMQEQTELLGVHSSLSLQKLAYLSPAVMSFTASNNGSILFTQAGICGAAQSFISNVTSKIFDVMKAAEAVKDVPIIGGLLGAIVRGVQIGLSFITRAVNALLAPVLGVVRAIGAALSVASTIVGTLSPWTVTLDLRPSLNEVGGNPGEIGISAGGWDQIAIPTAIRECASLAGVELPQPGSADAPVHLTVRQSRTLVILNTPELLLDTNGQTVGSYVTGPVTQGDRVVTGMAWITATVVQEDLLRLRDQLFNVLFSSLPGIITDVVRPLIGPIADNLSSQLLALVNAVGSQPLFVQYRERIEEEETNEEPDGEGSESDESNAQSVGCFPGKFRLVDPMALQRMFLPFPMDIEGTNDWDFQANGRLVVSFNNLEVTVHLDPTFPWDFTFNGTQSGTYSMSSGVLQAEITENNVEITSSMGAATASAMQSDFGGAGPLSGPYTCGDPLVWNPVYPEVGPVRYEFEPIV